MPTHDLQIFDADGLTLAEDRIAPAAVTGADKVAQRFVYYLFTPAGSVPGQSAVGTDFLETARSFRNEFDLFAAFAAAEPVAAGAVRACEVAADPAAERYGFARLSRIELAGDQVTFTLLVVAADGSTPAEPVAFTLDA